MSCVQVVWIKGHGHKRIVVLKNDMKSKYAPSLPPSQALGLSPAPPLMGVFCPPGRVSSLGLPPASHETQPSAPERILEVPESPPASELRLGVGGDGERGKTKAGDVSRTGLGVESEWVRGKDDMQDHLHSLKGSVGIFPKGAWCLVNNRENWPAFDGRQVKSLEGCW